MRWFIGLIKLRRRGIWIGMAGIKFGPSSEDDAKTIPRVQQTCLRLRFDWVSLLHGPSTRLRVGARPPSLYQRQDQWPTPSWYVKIHVRTEPPVGVDWSLHAILWSLRHRPINYAFDHYAWRSPSSVIPNLRTSSKCSMCLIRFLFCLFSAMSNWLQCEYMIAHHTTSTTFMLEYSNSQDLFMVGLHVRYCMRVFEGLSLLKIRRTWRYVPIPVIVSSLIILYTLTRLNQSETLMLAYLSML